MYCTQCGLQLAEDHRFCHRCGARTGVGPGADQPHRVLLLDKRNKKIAGVCAGIARYYNEDVTLIRVIVLTLALTTGIGFLGYLAAWIIIPSDHSRAPYPAPVAQT